MKKKLFSVGFLGGFVNGLLGSGGGMICVPLLRQKLMNVQVAHACTVCAMLSASIVSIAVYWKNGLIDFNLAWPYMFGGLLAAPIGVFLLKKAKPSVLRKSFAVFMIYCGVRILLNT